MWNLIIIFWLRCSAKYSPLVIHALSPELWRWWHLNVVWIMSRTQQKGSPVHHNRKKQDYIPILRQFQYFRHSWPLHIINMSVDLRFYNVCHHLLTRVTSFKACWRGLSGSSHSENISINTEARSKSQATHIYTALHTAPLHRDPDCSYQKL